jgi:hypothetical protein
MNLNSANLPRLFTYEQAIKHYQDVVPFRSGRDKGKRPLGNRRYRYCQIERIEETGAIILTMYGSDVVTMYPNGEVHVSLCNYDTIGTRQFILATTPYDIQHIRGTTYLGVKDKWYAFDTAQHTLEVRDGEVLNPSQQLTYKINRAAMKELHNKYKSFKEYVASMGKVLTAITDAELLEGMQNGSVPTHDSVGRYKELSRIMLPTARARYYHGQTKPRDQVAAFLSNVLAAQETEDLEKYRDLFLLLGASSLYYNSYLNAYVKGWGPQSEEAIGEPMLKFFDEMIKHHYREEVFVKVEVPIGEKCSNVNRQYF